MIDTSVCVTFISMLCGLCNSVINYLITGRVHAPLFQPVWFGLLVRMRHFRLAFELCIRAGVLLCVFGLCVCVIR